MVESLTSRDYWSGNWSRANVKKISFPFEHRHFRDLHRIYQKYIDHGQGKSVLEVGCYPGSYLWYFATQFGYKPHGVEFVEWCAKACEEALAEENIAVQVDNQDFFEYKLEREEDRHDLVVSFGFIEHFPDTAGVIRRHADCCKTGGQIMIMIPNHAGPYGTILKNSDPDVYAIHNHMGLREFRKALQELPELKVEYLGPAGRINFNASGLDKPMSRLGPLRLPVRAGLAGLEVVGQLLPNTPTLSAYLVLIARKCEPGANPDSSANS